MIPSERFRKVSIWVCIAAVVTVTVLLQRMRGDERAGADSSQAQVGSAQLQPVSKQAELAAKVVVAFHGLAPTLEPSKLLDQVAQLKEGPFTERLGRTLLVGFVENWQAGIDQAKTIALPEGAVDEARQLRDLAIAAMEKRAALAKAGDAEGSGAVDEITAMRPMLGFFADAVGPDAPSKVWTALAVLFAAAAWYSIVLLSGIIALVVLAVLAASNKIRPRLVQAPSPHAALVLGETFLLWITVFLSLNVLLVAVLEPWAQSLSASVHLLASIAVMICSLLIALAYPARRGIGWTELRTLIGLHRGRGVGHEILQGALCYVSSVPLLAIGFVVFVVMSKILEAFTGPSAGPSHPIVELFGDSTPFQVVLLYLLASVCAPIVEEIMFRGFFYGHLRSTVVPRVRVVSVLIAALASSAVFALIHPQGLLFVPVLGGLAVGFCLFREMRSSLIAPMVAHGINNAVTLTIGITLLS